MDRVRRETVERLQVRIPKAMEPETALVAAREFRLTIFPYLANYYVGLNLTSIEVIPAFAPVHVFLFRNDVELGQYANQGGVIALTGQTGVETPMQLSIYNLSVDTPVMLTFSLEGILYAV